MENEERSLVLFAEQTKVDLEKSDIFVMITFKLFDNGANRKPALLSKRYRDLGHRYDERTQTFETQQIGS